MHTPEPFRAIAHDCCGSSLTPPARLRPELVWAPAAPLCPSRRDPHCCICGKGGGRTREASSNCSSTATETFCTSANVEPWMFSAYSLRHTAISAPAALARQANRGWRARDPQPAAAHPGSENYRPRLKDSTSVSAPRHEAAVADLLLAINRRCVGLGLGPPRGFRVRRRRLRELVLVHGHVLRVAEGLGKDVLC
jgi:hypothetical protein